MKRLLTLLLVLSVGTGCKTPHAVRETILLADSLSYEMPDSALRLIERINPRSLHGKRDRADYGLIYSQVLDKNCVDVDRDTLIRPAVQYYTDRGTPLQRALAYYYWGRTLENADSTARAIEAFTLARRALGDDTLCRTFALICNRLGDAHESQYEFESAARMFRSSVNTFASLGEKYNEMIGCSQMVRNSILRGDFTDADEWNDSLYNLAIELADTTMTINSYTYKASILTYLDKNYLEAIQILANTKKKYGDLVPNEVNLQICNLYSCINSIDSARLYARLYEKACNLDLIKQLGILQVKGYIEHAAGNYKLSSDIRSEAICLQDSLYSIQRRLSIEELIRKYDYTIIQQQSIAERKEHHYRLLTGSLISLLIILICLWLMIRWIRIVQRQRVYIEDQKVALEHIQNSKYTLSDRLVLQEKNASILKEMLNNRLEQIRSLACTNYLYDKSKDLKERIERLVFDEKMFQDIELLVNLDYNGIIDELRQGKYGRFTEPDYKLLSMMLAGFTIQDCQIFMGYSYDNLYARRSRIRQKIRMSNGAQKEVLLEIFTH